ncbi:GM17490 [Drosophila sechellia]|uniref:GM17490 n=1 Tax=Drosophila sechellia TaxID=7238 RepID=B4IHH7_DROSE|nr:GM17490 [Drosophila sechellia]
MILADGFTWLCPIGSPDKLRLLRYKPIGDLLQTGVSLIVQDSKGSGDGSGIGIGATSNRRRTAQLATRKRKRRPQLPLATIGTTEEDSGPDPTSAYWRGHVEDDADALRRRNQPLVREPMAALERDREREKQRKRVEPTDSSPQGSSPSKAYRRPYGQAKKEPIVDAGAATPTKTSGKYRQNKEAKHQKKSKPECWLHPGTDPEIST